MNILSLLNTQIPCPTGVDRSSNSEILITLVSCCERWAPLTDIFQMNDQGFFFRYFFPLYALLLYIIMCAWDELQKLDFLHPEMYRGRTFAYYRDISYRRAVWFYERHMG